MNRIQPGRSGGNRSTKLGAALLVISIVLYVFLYAPIAVVMLHSFNRAKHGGAWQGFTTDW